MTPDQFNKVNDSMDQIIELVAGYREKLVNSGLSSVVIDAMLIEFHAFLMRSGGQK